MKHKKQFKESHPETIGEEDMTFDMSNYIDWLDDRYSKLEAQNKDLKDCYERGWKDGREELEAKLKNCSIPVVRYRFDIPDAESGFAYYDDTAYFDRDGFYMYDQDGNKKRPNEKYLVRK